MLIFGILILILGIALVAILFQRSSQPVITGEDFVWAAHFDASRYHSLERLLRLSEEDRKWLKSQPGFERRIWKTLSANRRKAIRLYLDQLNEDFHRLHEIVMLRTLDTPADQSATIRELNYIKNRFRLELHLLQIRVRLSSLRLVGLSTLDIHPLLKPLSDLANQIHIIAKPALICEPQI